NQAGRFLCRVITIDQASGSLGGPLRQRERRYASRCVRRAAGLRGEALSAAPRSGAQWSDQLADIARPQHPAEPPCCPAPAYVGAPALDAASVSTPAYRR